MSTLLPGDTPASPSRPQAKGKAKKTKDIYGHSSSTPFAQYDPATHSWKTCEATSLLDSETFSPTLPPAGILRTGKLFQRRRSARHTAATVSSSWPTPRSSAAMGEEISQIQTRLADGAPYKAKLEEAVALWPTPRSSHAMASNLETVRSSPRLTRGFLTFSRLEEHLAIRTSLTGKLNPGWVESLMGFPTGWTDLEDSETPSSLNSPNLSEG